VASPSASFERRTVASTRNLPSEGIRSFGKLKRKGEDEGVVDGEVVLPREYARRNEYAGQIFVVSPRPSIFVPSKSIGGDHKAGTPN